MEQKDRSDPSGISHPSLLRSYSPSYQMTSHHFSIDPFSKLRLPQLLATLIAMDPFTSAGSDPPLTLPWLSWLSDFRRWWWLFVAEKDHPQNPLGNLGWVDCSGLCLRRTGGGVGEFVSEWVSSCWPKFWNQILVGGGRYGLSQKISIIDILKLTTWVSLLFLAQR